MQKIIATAMPLSSVPQDKADEFIEWVWAMRKSNAFDYNVMKYPRTVMCEASNEEGTLMYVPLQPVLMFESIASKPGITEKQTAVCLRRITDLMEKVMLDSGHCEIYFLTPDNNVADLSAAHGWEDVGSKYRVMRRKIAPPIYPVGDTNHIEGAKEAINEN